MTYAAPSNDSFDDGLVHSHNWSRATPPGVRHSEGSRHATRQSAHDHDDGLVHEHHWARG